MSLSALGAIAVLLWPPQSGGPIQIVQVWEDAVFAVDRNSIRWNGQNPSVNFISIRDKPRYVEGAGFYQITVVNYELSCSDRKTRVTNTRFLTIDSRFVAEIEGDQEWGTITAEAPLDVGLDLVCTNRIPDPAPDPVADIPSLAQLWTRFLSLKSGD